MIVLADLPNITCQIYNMKNIHAYSFIGEYFVLLGKLFRVANIFPEIYILVLIYTFFSFFSLKIMILMFFRIIILCCLIVTPIEFKIIMVWL